VPFLGDLNMPPTIRDQVNRLKVLRSEDLAMRAEENCPRGCQVRFNVEEERFLRDNEVGRLATICVDGLPHLVPVCYIYRSGGLWVATDYETRKYRNLLRNNRVALVVDAGYDSNRGILVQGRARIYERGREFRKAYAAFYKKFNWVRATPWKEEEVPIIKIIPIRKACWGPRLK
jgi:nitroimidazol reductase NimA-like FMN-containing flavoprotein (pyridoxamine 5'-phosphate oxidase superfamily)